MEKYTKENSAEELINQKVDHISDIVLSIMDNLTDVNMIESIARITNAFNDETISRGALVDRIRLFLKNFDEKYYTVLVHSSFEETRMDIGNIYNILQEYENSPAYERYNKVKKITDKF